MSGAALQRARRGCSGGDKAPGIVRDVLRSEGRPLDNRVRAYMEPRFGRDFSHVRVHTDDDAGRSAAAVGAEAYTVGQHVVFGNGRFSASTREGKSLLAHELAHTVQQRSARETSWPVAATAPSDASERSAHALAESAAARRPLPPVWQTGPQLARATRTFLLTFDDGPDGLNPVGGGKNLTENVLNQLCEKGAQAGFFVQTAADIKITKTKTVPGRGSTSIGTSLIKRMNSDGHMIGIHTGGKADHESHPSAFHGGRLESELRAAKTFLTGITGKTPTMVRPPFGQLSSKKLGVKSSDVLSVYKKLSLSNTLWDIDGDASRRKGKSANLADIKDNIRDGLKAVIARGWKGTTPLDPMIVVLLHDIRPNTSANVGNIIDFIRSETTAQSGGKDTASFPAVTCGQGSAGSMNEPGDYEPSEGDQRLAEADAPAGEESAG